MADVRHSSDPDTPARQPDFFVGWWEVVFHIRDGEHTAVTGMIEHVNSAGNFTVLRDGERIGAGRHVEFTVDPDGFTNVQEVAGAHTQPGRELAVYRFSGHVLEGCKARERQGRPTSFASSRGSGWIHAAIRRISDDDPRIPLNADTHEGTDTDNHTDFLAKPVEESFES